MQEMFGGDAIIAVGGYLEVREEGGQGSPSRGREVASGPSGGVGEAVSGEAGEGPVVGVGEAARALVLGVPRRSAVVAWVRGGGEGWWRRGRRKRRRQVPSIACSGAAARCGAPSDTCVRRGYNQGAGAGSRPFVGCGSQGLGDARRREAGADRCEHAPGVGCGGPCKSWVLMSAELPLSRIKCRRAGLLAGASHAMPPPGLVQAELDVG